MTLEKFVLTFGEEFDETPIEDFTSSTDFKNLEEWSSLTGLSIIAMVEDNFDIMVTGEDLRSVTTIEQLYNLVINK